MMSFFSRIWTAITGLFAAIWPNVEPMLKDLATDAGKMALKYAFPAVSALMLRGISGTEASNLAFVEIVNNMKREGLEIGVNYATRIINQAIEATVAKVVPK
jgi:hypothetical protein